jgi:hypothetical protein
MPIRPAKPASTTTSRKIVPLAILRPTELPFDRLEPAGHAGFQSLERARGIARFPIRPGAIGIEVS